MRQRLQAAINALAAAAGVLLVSVFISNFARAEDFNYGKIGWWQIIYREVSNLNGCQAGARFDDQTEIAIALIQDSNIRTWRVFISNPRWDSWIRRKTQHTLFIVAINPNKLWQGPLSVNSNNELTITASIDFIKSLADAKAIAIYDQNKCLLTSPPLSLKDSEDAIRSVVSCVRQHPPKTARPPEADKHPEQAGAYSGTAFFVAPNFLLTNNHVIKGCRNDIQVRYPDRKTYTATISGRDEMNDLALLQTDMGNQSVATFRSGARLGATIATYGFPYSELLSSGGNFTTGSVTSLSGLRKDSRFIHRA